MRRKVLQGVALCGVAALVVGLFAEVQLLIGLGAVALFGGLIGAGLEGSAGRDKGRPATRTQDGNGAGGGSG